MLPRKTSKRDPILVQQADLKEEVCVPASWLVNVLILRPIGSPVGASRKADVFALDLRNK